MVRRRWLLLVAVTVVAVTGSFRYRPHGIFASHTNTSAGPGGFDHIVPSNPKHVSHEVFGDPAAMATINAYTFCLNESG